MSCAQDRGQVRTRGGFSSRLTPLSFFLATVLGAWLLSGCGTPTCHVRNKKDPTYTNKLERVLLVYPKYDNPIWDKFATSSTTLLTTMLQQKGVALERLALPYDTLDQSTPVQEAAKRFEARQILVLNIPTVASYYTLRRKEPGTLTPFNSISSITLTLTLADLRVKRHVWRGQLLFPSNVPTPEAVAAAALDQLLKDQML